MTTTASKHGLKKAAQERTNRHAQRTPLPPREKAELHLPEPESKSAGKALSLIIDLDKHGWVCDVNPIEGDIVELVAKRGDEVLWISWTEGKLTTEPMPTYTIADRTVKLRNASQVRQYAARLPEVGTKELERVAANRFFRPKPVEPKRHKLPFDPATATDKEIIDSLLGKAVAWHNRLRVIEETAQVGRVADPKKIYFTEYAGDRIFNFLCPEGGHRAFRISALIKVGPKRFHSASKVAQPAEVTA